MKNKNLCLTAALSFLAFAAMAQVKPFAIKGKIAGKTDGTIYLIYQKGLQKIITDSTKITAGAFMFKGTVDGVTSARILSELGSSTDARAFQIFVSPGSQMVTIPAGDFSNGLLSGTPVAEELKQYNEFVNDIQPQLDKVMRDYYTTNSAIMKATSDKADAVTLTKLKTDLGNLRTALSVLGKQMQEKKLDYINKFPNSYVAAWILSENLTMPDINERYAKLSPDVAASNVGKQLKKGIDKAKLGTVGSVAAPFSGSELRGGQLSLADYKGKYVLLDFWASWCVPCRKGNPHLIDVYNQYESKGFEIIGVSDDDRAPDSWRKAVEDDKIGIWKHVLNGTKWMSGGGINFDSSNSILDKYNISVLPTKILVDPNGVIVGRYGSDDDLDKKLAEIYK
ncbi:TlpA disulfide reductase family protein [Pedobacter africanus]|uniref:Thiol-disulfide isomerase or thioredoxin n=1 Tax=Pedobacter africanus TaxID=151894 RepID=A0A1W2B014_9SPHI|nr:TlpA disulfide reductase family protein [Pedobacter africanus]SMC66051.1 Thiol-disulfide isomerase or thioredoxin [Pedobacter africanus]